MKDFIRSLWTSFFLPQRVFIALMLAVIIWLFPFTHKKTQVIQPIENGVIIIETDPLSAEALGPCSAVHCDPGYCCNPDRIPLCGTQGCHGGGDDPTPVPIYPPDVNGTLECSESEVNDWCPDTITLKLTATEPQGNSVIISGSVDGVAFSCPVGYTCNIPISTEGSGPVTFKVDSTTGLSDSGSDTYYIDRTSPDLDGSLSGVMGSNNWYVSNVNMTALASDSISDLASLQMTVDGGSSTTYTATTFTDGIHSVLLTATDNAGNSTSTTLSFQIDTITPSLSLAVSGTTGSNGWYSSSVKVTPTASDSGSGLARIEASKDGGTWSIVNGPLSFTDGYHTYQFKATDIAGNVTESPLREVYVDTMGPDVQLLSPTSLGEILLYEVQDDGSELAQLQFVIGDEEERFEKVAWSENIMGSYYDDGILWDGKFKDGTQAPTGTYYLTIKAIDKAGNETRKTGSIEVDFFSFLQDIPPFDPPISPSENLITNSASAATGESESSSDFGGTVVSRSENEYTKTEFLAPGTTNQPLTATTESNPSASSGEAILWGAAAAAAVGAFVAEAQRKREEEAARRAAEAAARAAADRAAFLARIEEDGKKNDNRILSYKQRAKAYQASLDNFKASLIKSGLTPEEAAAAKTKALLGGSIPSVASVVATKNRNDAMEAKMTREDAADEAKWLTAMQAKEVAQTPMPSGLSPEAQQAYLRSSQAAGWVAANTPQLQEEYAHYLADQQEQAKQEGEKSSSNILKKAWDWVSSPATWWGLASDNDSVDLMKDARGLPLYLPLIKGVGPQYPNINAPAPYLERYGVQSLDEIVGPLKATLGDGKLIRALGRTIGDVGMPVTLVFGLGLTVYPNLKTNLVNGNGGSRIMADLAIDTGGFIFSELVGWVAGIGTALVTGNPFVGIGAKLSADFAASVAYDNFVAAHGWREALTNAIEASKPLPPAVPPIPNPTPRFPQATPSFQEPAGESSLNISSGNQASSVDVVPIENLQPTELIPTPTETPKPGP